MTTSCMPCSSSGRNTRPRYALMPNVEKKFALAADDSTRSGSALPVRTAFPKTVRAASDENTEFRSR
jgi:hypothetical protein